MNSAGVLYIATSQKHFKEAIESVKTFKSYNDGIKTALFTSEELSKEPAYVFDEIHVMKEVNQSYVDKIRPLNDSPFDKTLFLDTDTKVLGKVEELFTILDRFDLAFSYAPLRNSFTLNDVPDWFLEPNSGVLLFRKNEETNKVFKNWLSIYEDFKKLDTPPPHDQAAFRKALYINDKISFYSIGHEYNFRAIFASQIPGNLPIKVFHDRYSLEISKQILALRKDRSTKHPYVIFPSNESMIKNGFIIDKDNVISLEKFFQDKNKVSGSKGFFRR